MDKFSLQNINYNDISDEQIIEYIFKGDSKAQDFIINKYKKSILIKSRIYFIFGADNEDIIQEGMIGLYKAIREFDPNKGVKFATFAELCISRQIYTAIKLASRKKHEPLNNSISLSNLNYKEENKYIYNPELIFIYQEIIDYIYFIINKTLSKIEKQVFYLHLEGNTYSEISNIINKNQKAVDNAIQRARKKIINRIKREGLTKVNLHDKI